MALLALLIDDDSDDLQFLAESIAEIDNNVVCHAHLDSVKALEWLKANLQAKPDYIFIDINMPKLNGIECLRELRSIRQLDSSVVVVQSTGLTSDMQTTLKNFGANYSFCKPDNYREYSKHIRKVFQRSVHAK